MENKDRNIPSLGKGRASWLVWNMRDLENQYVGSGVYIWNIVYTPIGDTDESDVAAEFTDLKKQGVIRSDQAFSCVEPFILNPP